MKKEQFDRLVALSSKGQLTLETRDDLKELLVDYEMSMKLMAPLVVWGQANGLRMGCQAGENVISRIHSLAMAMVEEPMDACVLAVAREIDEANLVINGGSPTIMAKLNALKFIRAFQNAVIRHRPAQNPPK